ncbi:MAG: peptide deformylase [Candidatus Levybacteria bacterium]|nr:peptide deformylase [Candidatus Levybacteria bacterium]
MLKIVTAPNSVLSQKAQPVKKIDKNVLDLVEEMKATLLGTKDPVGVGLAAPQVGHSLRIFLAKPTPKSEIMVCVNPKILSRSEELKPLKRPKNSSNKRAGTLEGCLSLPTIWGTVLRSSSLTFSYTDGQDKTHKRSCKDFLATIVQHEIDHLDGVLFPKRVLEQKGKLYKSRKNEKGEEEFEEIEI